MILDELLVKLGFDYNPKDLDKFKKDVGKTADIVKNFARVAVGAATALTGLVVASTQASDSQGKLADEIGITVANLDALQFANKRAGGSADEMGNSLRDLSIRAAEASRGVGSGVEAFGELGINVRNANGSIKSSSDLMIEISDRIQTFSKAEQINFADKLGVRGSLKLLQQGSAAIKEVTDEALALGTVTAEDAAIAAEFQDGLTDVWQIMKDISRLIAAELAPGMTQNIDDFSEWWKINRDIIRQKFGEWLNKVVVAVKLLTIAFSAFIGLRLLTHFVALINLMKGLTAATVAMNAAAFLLPIVISTIALAFLALWNDAKVFFEGGESFIGDMLQKYPEWVDEITTVAAIFGTIDDLTGKIFEGWENIFNLFKNADVENIKEVFKNLPGFVGEVTGINDQNRNNTLVQGLESIGRTKQTFVDKVEIFVQGGVDGAEKIAQEVMNVFQQTSKDLNSAVDQ